MAFPFLFLSAALIFGIWLCDLVSLPLSISLAGLASALALAWISFRFKKNRAALGLILAAAFFLGAALYGVFDIRFEQNALHRLTQTTYADFTGTLALSPSPGLDRDYFYLRVDKVFSQNREERVGGNLRISVPHSSEFRSREIFSAGDVVKISAQIVPRREYRNFREPFSRMYLKSQLLHNLAATKSPLLIQKIRSGPRFSPSRLVSLLRQKCERNIERFFASRQKPERLSPEGAVFETLILGGRGRLTPETTRTMQKTGLFHLLAISGAHIGIISFFVFGFLRFLRVPVRSSYIVLIFFLIFYALLVEGRASVLRAVIMSLAFLFGKLLWKDVHPLNTISLSAFVLLLFNPFQLFDLGFQLTYAATLSIILFFPKVTARLPKLPLKISETFAMSLTAQMGVLPLIALSFNRIIFSGLLLNMIGIPLVGLIMAAGYLFLPVAFLGSVFARPFAAVITFLIKVFLGSTHLLDALPFLSYRIPTPPAFVVVGYFLFLLLLLLPAGLRIWRRVCLVPLVGFSALLIFYPFSSATRDLRVTFIDVGQGDSVLLEFPGGKKMLVDGGGLPTGNFDVGESVVSPFLWSRGIKKIDYLVLTHPHPDHLNGLIAEARNFRIGEFWEALSPPGEPKYEELKAELSKVPERRVFGGFTRREGNVEIRVLSPREESPPVSPMDNEKSMVMKISYGETSLLLAADIGAATESDLVAGAEDIKSDVLKAPHHGSSSSSSEAFLSAVSPRLVVISSGSGNPYGFPHQETLARYAKIGARVLRTDLRGAVEIDSDGRTISIRTSEPEAPGPIDSRPYRD